VKRFDGIEVAVFVVEEHAGGIEQREFAFKAVDGAGAVQYVVRYVEHPEFSGCTAVHVRFLAEKLKSP
jgi:hypothetical protein